NLAISELRRRNRRRLTSLQGFFRDEESEDKDYDPVDGGQLPDRKFESDERSRIIGRAIASLPENYRLPIVLRDVEG
ncbi:hypothetical protein OFM13_34720, partial [Escherichia coli]|nr:hypothetical protein [Escherichia coli]